MYCYLYCQSVARPIIYGGASLFAATHAMVARPHVSSLLSCVFPVVFFPAILSLFAHADGGLCYG